MKKNVNQYIIEPANICDENPNPVLRVLLDGTIVYANKSSELLLAVWNRKRNENLPARWLDVLKKAHLTNSVISAEMECDHTIYSLSITPVQGTKYVNIYAHNVTDRKKVEDMIQELAKFPDENPNPVMRILLDGTIVYANKSSELLMYTWNRKLNEKVPERWLEVLKKANMTNKVIRKELECDNTVYSLSITPVKGTNYVNIYAHNITVRKQYEIEREQIIEELENKNAELERFVYTVSHDLKSPLFTIKSFIELLNKDILNHVYDDMLEFINRINKSADKMIALIQGLLDLAKNGVVISPDMEISANEIVQDAVDLLGKKIKDNNIELRIMDNMPVIFCDRIRMIEVYQNLIENAVKFVKPEGTRFIEIGYNDFDGEQVFYVKDNGIGIEPQYQERIFGIFERLNNNYEGSGLGLTLIKRIIESHGGKIWVESQGANKGTAFLFTLSEPKIILKT